MAGTYQATGIVLKGMPLGEADRLVTLLTPEFGLIRAVVPGARQYRSPLRGRSELFVVNQLLIARGRSLDKITQAETLKSYPGLSRDLGKLAAAQYLAELVLSLALSEQPQIEVYELLNEHLRRLESLSLPPKLYPNLAQAAFHLLAIAGFAPQVYHCCHSRRSLTGNWADAHWRAGFSFAAGGLIDLSDSESPPPASLTVNGKLGAVELTLLQHLSRQSLPEPAQLFPPEFCHSSLEGAWARVERLLRDYAQYQLGRSFRSAVLVDALSELEF